MLICTSLVIGDAITSTMREFPLSIFRFVGLLSNDGNIVAYYASIFVFTGKKSESKKAVEKSRCFINALKL